VTTVVNEKKPAAAGFSSASSCVPCGDAIAQDFCFLTRPLARAAFNFHVDK